MTKRQLILNDYRTAEDGLWTLASCKVTKAAQVQNIIEVPGRLAPLDLSTVLTDGQPYYSSALLDAVLESSAGTRDERTLRILYMMNRLDGYSVNIILPDYPNNYMVGRVQVDLEYNDLAHSAVHVTAVCEPWLYNAEETIVTAELTDTDQTVTLGNGGRLVVVPTVEVTEEATIAYGGRTQVLSAGSYSLPWLALKPGLVYPITCSGSGTVTFTYREAVLAQ